MKYIVLLTIVVFCITCAGQENVTEKKIGIVSVKRVDKEKGVVKDYQQTVWESILNKNPLRSLNYQMVLIGDNQLTSSEELKQYHLIIIPGSRSTLPVSALDVLKAYIKSGGWLIYEAVGPFCLDIDGDGILSPGDSTKESREMVSKFWQDVAGVSIASRPVFNLISKIRANTAIPSLTANLPLEFTELDIAVKMPHPYYNCTYYQLSTAKPLVEAVVINIPTKDFPKNLQGEEKKLDGTFPVVAINQYGKGVCISLGINSRAIFSPPASFYTTLLHNIFSHALHRAPLEYQ